MMAFRVRLIVPFTTPDVQFWFVNPNHQKPEKSEDGLHPSGMFWARNCEKSSPTKTTKVISLFQPFMSGHRFSTYTIAETESENQSLRLLQLDTNKNSMSLLLVCVHLNISDDVFQQSVSDASNRAQNRAAKV